MLAEGPRDTARHARQERLLTQYECLHDEIRELIRQESSHVRGLVAAMGVLVGYSLYTGHLVFLGMVSVLIGLVFVQSVVTHNQILFVGRQLVDIEDALAHSAESTFRYERVRGGAFGRERRGSRFLPSLTDVPHLFRISLGVVGYVSFAVVATRPAVWAPYHDTIPTFAGIALNRELAKLLLVVYFVGLFVVAVAHGALRRRIHDDIDGSSAPIPNPE